MKRMNWKVALGDRWVTCDVCDFGYRFSQMRRGVTGTQKGLIVCPDCFDIENPSEKFVYKNTTEGKLEDVK